MLERFLAQQRRRADFDVKDGQGDTPEANLRGWHKLLAFFLFFGIPACFMIPKEIGKAVAGTDADPLGLGFLVALYPFAIFWCIYFWAVTVRSQTPLVLSLLFLLMIS